MSVDIIMISSKRKSNRLRFAQQTARRQLPQKRRFSKDLDGRRLPAFGRLQRRQRFDSEASKSTKKARRMLAAKREHSRARRGVSALPIAAQAARIARRAIAQQACRICRRQKGRPRRRIAGGGAADPQKPKLHRRGKSRLAAAANLRQEIAAQTPHYPRSSAACMTEDDSAA